MPEEPKNPKALKYYGYFLKIEGSAYLGISILTYVVKWGLAWHDAGRPFAITGAWGIKFSAYWNMILIIYTSLGVYITLASFDPANYKPLLSWAMWGGNFCHGVVAFIHCFTDNFYLSSAAPIGGYANLDKLFFAVPLWFSLFVANLLFAKAAFGSFLLPCGNLVTPSSGVQKVAPA